jgi:hypothetical protein
MNIMTIKMANGNIVSRRIDHVDSIAWNKETGLCQIWYNYEPEGYGKNYIASVHYFDEFDFYALLNAWKKSESVEITERENSNTLNNDMLHEMFRKR